MIINCTDFTLDRTSCTLVGISSTLDDSAHTLDSISCTLDSSAHTLDGISCLRDGISFDLDSITNDLVDIPKKSNRIDLTSQRFQPFAVRHIYYPHKPTHNQR